MTITIIPDMNAAFEVAFITQTLNAVSDELTHATTAGDENAVEELRRLGGKLVELGDHITATTPDATVEMMINFLCEKYNIEKLG